jgi:uncharacterized protein
MIEFEWDPQKERSNIAKHRIAFTEATAIFFDPLAITVFDPEHSQDEERYITVGASASGCILMVAHTDRMDRIRIITARELTRAEKKAYEKEIEERGRR